MRLRSLAAALTLATALGGLAAPAASASDTVDKPSPGKNIWLEAEFYKAMDSVFERATGSGGGTSGASAGSDESVDKSGSGSGDKDLTKDSDGVTGENCPAGAIC